MTALSLGRVPLTFLLAVAAALVPVSTAHAAKAPLTVAVERASGMPSTYFSQTATPGETTPAGVLVVRNRTDHSVPVQLNRVNAQTADALGSAYGAAGESPRGATAWTRLGVASLQLAPGERRRIAIDVEVPASASPGDYLAGISVFSPEQSHTTPVRGGLMIGEEYRYAIGVETRVPGPRSPNLEFTSAALGRQPSGPVTLIEARNDGNVTLTDVHGWAWVTQGDRTVARVSIGPGTFVAATSATFPVRMAGEDPSPGATYRVRATLWYGSRVVTLDTMVRFGAGPTTVDASAGTAVGAPGSPGGAGGATGRKPATRGAAGGTATTPNGSARPSRSPATAPAAGSAAARSHGLLQRVLGKRIAAAIATIAHAVRRAAGPVAARSAFPAVLALVMVLFLFFQDAIDRRDPKLALAPVRGDDLVFTDGPDEPAP